MDVNLDIKVERWMLNSYITEVDQDGLESSTLGLNFLVLPDHFRNIYSWFTYLSSLLKNLKFSDKFFVFY